MPVPRKAFAKHRRRLGPAVWWRRWWKRLAPHWQDGFAALVPMLAVLLFFATIVAAFGYLRLEEIEREQEALQRDVEYSQQRLRLRLLDRQEQLMRLARDVSSREVDTDEFIHRAESLINQYPELSAVSWIDARRRIRASYAAPSVAGSQLLIAGETLNPDEAISTFILARELKQPVYSAPLLNTDGPAMLQLQIPLADRGRFNGVILGEFSIDGMLRHGIPTEVAARYAVALADSKGTVLAGNVVLPTRDAAAHLLPWTSRAEPYEVPVSPVGNGLVIRAQPFRTSLGVIGSGLFWLVGLLSLMTSWMLIGNWRHTRKRLQAQTALITETNFRRAMENSILTGMRALDLGGRITYVNAAFCQMTGWSESELVGRNAPFPYWPDEDHDKLNARLDEELSGGAAPDGFQVRIKRKNGVHFIARLYVSPLVDAGGQQTGWMTSMADVTEQNRIRDQLAASYERFTTVLDALDAAVSVVPMGDDELLFVNKLYRQWFGTSTAGHLQLAARAGEHPAEMHDQAATEAGASADQTSDARNDNENVEVYAPLLDRWLEVRSRYLSWVDGRLAQMVIATDITARRTAEEQAAAQAERAQNTNRLITMGEMASSVAHELNQPLTAISNYCSGMVSRIKANQISQEDLLGALDKTARQAQRAGQIILRIRSFVKRSEPNRTPSNIEAIVNDAVELAGIEMRRRNVRLRQYVASRLPMLLVEPILIEQVLVNLLKNAAEAIDQAQLLPARRGVELRVVPKRIAEQDVVEFSVQDNGRGLAPEVIDRVYEAFFSTKTDGMGIGLNLCRTIVESHQGRMQAENIYNQGIAAGCRFSFWIPLAATLEADRKLPETVTHESRMAA